MSSFALQRFLAVLEASETLPALPMRPRSDHRALLHILAERMTPEACAEYGTFAAPGVEDDTR